MVETFKKSIAALIVLIAGESFGVTYNPTNFLLGSSVYDSSGYYSATFAPGKMIDGIVQQVVPSWQGWYTENAGSRYVTFNVTGGHKLCKVIVYPAYNDVAGGIYALGVIIQGWPVDGGDWVTLGSQALVNNGVGTVIEFSNSTPLLLIRFTFTTPSIYSTSTGISEIEGFEELVVGTESGEALPWGKLMVAVAVGFCNCVLFYFWGTIGYWIRRPLELP